MERNKALGIGITAVVVAAFVGWVAGRQIQSPAEIAANTDAPNASLISVPVEKVRLASEVVTRGTVGYSSPVEVTMPASALKTGSVIITTVPKKNEELQDGTVAFTLSGRPVFVLQGDQPMARDLTPGTQGADVLQLQEGLARLGFDPGRRDGVYDGGTANAVAAWYRSVGQTPMGPTDEQIAAAAAAQGDVAAAQGDVAGAEEALAAAQATEAAAIGLVNTNRAALQDAVAAQQLAHQQLDAGRNENPPLMFVEITALETAARTADGAVALALTELDSANAALGPASEGVQAAARRVSAAQGRTGTAGGAAGQLAGKMGISVPADELLFFPVLPARVNEVTGRVGQEANGPIMTVSGSQLAVEGALSQADQKLVREGAEVRIEESELNVRAQGSVSAIAAVPGPPPADIDPSRYYLQVTPVNMPASLVGTSVVLNISVGSTEGEVLAVPVGALSVGANGKSRVQVQEKGGRRRYVIVTPGLTARGLVEVVPERGTLDPGDLVILGKGAKGSNTGAVPTTRRTTSTSSPGAGSTTTTLAPDPGSGAGG